MPRPHHMPNGTVYSVYAHTYTPENYEALADCLDGSVIVIQNHASKAIRDLLAQTQLYQIRLAAMKSPDAFSIIFEELATAGYLPLNDEHHTWKHRHSGALARIVPQDGQYNIQHMRSSHAA